MTFEVCQNGIVVAIVECDDEQQAMREAMHYAMVYAQDGPVIVRKAEADEAEETA